jgi:hypothetical protein
MVHSLHVSSIFDVKVENPFRGADFTSVYHNLKSQLPQSASDFMPTDAAILAASLTGFFGALIVAGVGVRFTRSPSVLVCSGAFSGAALAALMYVLWGWFAHGFVLFQASVLPLAVLILLLVMTAQNWFVFYEDRQDVLQSSRPALVMLAAAVAALLARIVAGKHSFLILMVWASAASLAILLCIDPVQRSIERTRSVLGGTLVGIGKVLVPFTGIVVFLQRIQAPLPERHDVAAEASSIGSKRFLLHLVGLFWDLGQIILMTLINGARVPPRSAALDPLEMLGQERNGHSISGEMSRRKRDSVVMIFVLALHVLCGVVIVKA